MAIHNAAAMGRNLRRTQMAIVSLGGEKVAIKNLQLKRTRGNQAGKQRQAAQHEPCTQAEVG